MQLANGAALRGEAASAASAAASRPLGIAGTALLVVRQEGVLGLYAGLSGSVLRQTVLVGSRLGVYDGLKNFMADDNGKLDFATSLGCGAAAGAIAAAIGNPADLVMVRMQAGVLTAISNAPDCQLHACPRLWLLGCACLSRLRAFPPTPLPGPPAGGR